MSNETRYITFPIVIMKDALLDIRQCMADAIHYSCYVYCLGLNGKQAERVEKAGTYFGITYSKNAFDNGKILYDSIPDRSAKTSITKDMVFEFYGGGKTEFEIVTFLAFAAIRSIIQMKAYNIISNQWLISRMSGNNDKLGSRNVLLAKYDNRYQLDRIKTELQLSWGLKLYGKAMRGYYVSFKLTLPVLIEQAELNRKTAKINKLKEEKKEAYKTAINAIVRRKELPKDETTP